MYQIFASLTLAMVMVKSLRGFKTNGGQVCAISFSERFFLNEGFFQRFSLRLPVPSARIPKTNASTRQWVVPSA